MSSSGGFSGSSPSLGGFGECILGVGMVIVKPARALPSAGCEGSVPLCVRKLRVVL